MQQPTCPTTIVCIYYKALFNKETKRNSFHWIHPTFLISPYCHCIRDILHSLEEQNNVKHEGFILKELIPCGEPTSQYMTLHYTWSLVR